MANLLRKGDRTELTLPAVSTRTTTAAATSGKVTAPISYTSTKKSHADSTSPWDVAQRWVQTIAKEDATRRDWKRMYGWMADYNSRGELIERKPPDDNSTRFSNKLPNTGGHDYGWRLHSASGQEIRNLQRRFDHHYRKPVHVHYLGYDW